MAFTLTDTEIKDLSLTAVQLPLVMDDAETGAGIVQQKEAFEESRASLLLLDDQNKIFSDLWIDVISSYHTELASYEKELRTNHSEDNIVLGAQGLEPHYTSTWVNTVPILSDSVKGLPYAESTTTSESELTDEISDYVELLTSGFNDGLWSGVIDDDYIAGSGSFIMNSGAFSAGSRAILESNGISVYGVIGEVISACSISGIDDKTSCVASSGDWTVTYTFTPISPDVSLMSGAGVRVYHAGFTDLERGHQSINYAADVMVFFQDEIDTKVVEWKKLNLDQIDILDANSDITSSNKVSNALAKVSTNSLNTDLTSWQDIELVSASGRFTDTNIGTIAALISTRMTNLNARILEIESILGSPVQGTDGTVTGTGVYLNLYKVISLRAAKAGGSLYSWYMAAMALGFFDVRLANAQSQLDQLNNVFAISKIVSDTEVGQLQFIVDGTSELQSGEIVKVMDNDSVVYTRTITSLDSSTIVLDSGIPSALTVDSAARIVRAN